MPVARLHGVEVVWSADAIASDPLAEVLALAEPAQGAPIASIRVDLGPAGAEAAADPRAEGWEPSFFHGIVQAYRGQRGLLFWDRASRVLLGGGAAPIEAAIAPPDREIEPGSAVAMLQVVIALALRQFDLYHLHAAALVQPSGESVLVVGGSGAGKTTTTLALLEGGARYLGDDALFLSRNGGGVRAGAFPRAFHLGPATLSAFPRLAPLAGPARGAHGKRPLDPRRAWPDRFIPALALDPGRVIALFPTIADASETTLAPIARADAFGLLIASSAAVILDDVGGREENLAVLHAVLAAARCFELRLGRDALADPVEAIAARLPA